MIKPHILLTLVDDWGWANAGWHQKSPEVATPQMDALVSSGIELERHYEISIDLRTPSPSVK